MEAAAGRGAPLLVSSGQPSRKERRAEHSLHGNDEAKESERVSMGQSDERTIYEERARPVDVEFCSITIDGGGSSEGVMQQRLEEVVRQSEELQKLEVGLRARAIARSEIMELQSSYGSKIKEHADANSQLKGQLQERERYILELEMNLEVKDRELRAVKMDNEAAWAKEDLLREQHKELATFRRDRDNSEAEKAQHLKNLHELQKHFQDKESQFLALEEQHRVTKEAIFYKDGQLREAQAWIARAQEMDALHSTTIQSLQAELRERIEQFNQYWIAFQRQFADMERHHLQAIQQLQHELAEARGHNGVYKDDSQLALENSRVQDEGNHINVNGGVASNADIGCMSNGNTNSTSSFGSASIESAKVSGVQVVPSSILGMNAFLPPNQMNAFHPFIIQPQGVPHSVSSYNLPNPQYHEGIFHPVSSALVQQCQNEQAAADNSQVTNRNNSRPSQKGSEILNSDDPQSYQHSAERQVVHPDHSNTFVYSTPRPDIETNGSNVGPKVLESNVNLNQVSRDTQEEVVNTKTQFHASVGYAKETQKDEFKVRDENTMVSTNQSQGQGFTSEQERRDSIAASFAVESHPVSSSVSSSPAVESHPVSSNSVAKIDDDGRPSSVITKKAVEPTLLDERSLLACIVRAIPAGSNGRIRISDTLPNRLGKMIAPLHWHDYKKYYGKLDDFVAHHPELFVIKGDFIHLREGAQEIISATRAYARVAAAASSALASSVLPPISVTPVAQNIHHKWTTSSDSHEGRIQNSTLHNQSRNGVASSNIVDGLANLKFRSKHTLHKSKN